MRIVQQRERPQEVIIRKKHFEVLEALKRLGGAAYPYEIVEAAGNGSYTGCLKRLKRKGLITISEGQVVTLTESGKQFIG